MNNEFGMKELYSVVFKATYPIEIGGIEYAKGEVIAAFDKIMLAHFNELKKLVAAKGGFENRMRVIWNTSQGLKLQFTQGIFSKKQFALLSDSKLSTTENNTITISKREFLESDENGIIELKYVPESTWIFIYNEETSEKITGAQMVSEKEINIGSPYTNVIADYEYTYTDEVKVLTIGQEIFDGFVSCEGKTKVKDDITGQVKTGILRIPKLKLTSNLSITLGTDAQPVVQIFEGIGLPVGPSYRGKAMEIYFLNDDIDSDF